MPDHHSHPQTPTAAAAPNPAAPNPAAAPAPDAMVAPEQSPRALVVTGHGINAELELLEVLRRAGAEPVAMHINDLVSDPSALGAFRLLALPGGFSFGDHLGSGKVLANLVRRRLGEALSAFTAAGNLTIGICNGFQVLAKAGILPNTTGDAQPEVTLVHNADGRFQDRWVRLVVNLRNPSPWLRGAPGLVEFPIRHGEGRFLPAEPSVLTKLNLANQVAFRYQGRNPNGSADAIAGITDPTGRVLGLMPHPEAFLDRHNHPRWTYQTPTPSSGLWLFENAVAHLRAPSPHPA